MESSAYSSLIKQGCLYKQSSYYAYLKQWRTKWIVLKGFCVLIFDQKPVDHKTNDVTEIYDLSIYDYIRVLSNSNGSYEFELFSSDTNISATKFKANTNKEMIEWIDCIKKQQYKVSINHNINEEDEVNVLSSISQLIDDGFSYDDTQLALKKSINDDDESDDESVLNVYHSFDPRSMFETPQSVQSTTKGQQNDSHLATALISVINENMEGTHDQIAPDIDCKDIFNDIHYDKISHSIQEILSVDDNDEKVMDKIEESRMFEMKSMNEQKKTHNDNMNDMDISDLCVLAIKQLQLLQNEENVNMIQIKKMNLMETLNKIKQTDSMMYTNMMRDKQWSIFMENTMITS